VNTIRWVRNLRNRIPDKGRPYFAYRLMTGEGVERFAAHSIEVTFNYLGKLQQLERSDALLKPFHGVTNTNFDIGSDVPRFALIEISAQVTHGTLRMSFSYNRNMKRQAKVRRWIVECQRCLQEAASHLAQLKPEGNFDFPLLPLSYNGIPKLVERLPLLGVDSLEDIEDVYPLSPMQQGMMLAQVKHPHLYSYVAEFEAKSSTGHPINARLLAEAWQVVIQVRAFLRDYHIPLCYIAWVLLSNSPCDVVDLTTLI
jgi:non-ribosomal peptide synthase protein (TIGR01720 family)